MLSSNKITGFADHQYDHQYIFCRNSNQGKIGCKDTLLVECGHACQVVPRQGLSLRNNLGGVSQSNYFCCLNNDSVSILDPWIYQSICLQS